MTATPRHWTLVRFGNAWQVTTNGKELFAADEAVEVRESEGPMSESPTVWNASVESDPDSRFVRLMFDIERENTGGSSMSLRISRQLLEALATEARFARKAS